MIFIIISITLVYLLLIGSFSWGFDRVKTFELSDLKPKTRFSIIVPFRNEAQHLAALLDSIAQLNYPKQLFQLILVDDESEDDSLQVLHTHQINSESNLDDIRIIKNVRTTNSPKKDALTLAISQAKYEWIITTDADCILPKYWLDSFDEFIQKQKPDFIVAPVTYQHVHGFLKNFQLLEVLSLQGATIGSFGINKPFMCNGANLAYKKDSFHMLNGYTGNSEIASGDDVFLLEKALQHNGTKVRYLKSKHAVVHTLALDTRSEVIEQRVRWAAKSSAYRNLFGKLSGFIILAQNALLLCCLFLMLIGIISPKEFLYIFIIKFSIDFLLVYKTADFFGQKKHLQHFLLASLYYPFFSVYVAFIAVFKGFKWKGRQYRK